MRPRRPPAIPSADMAALAGPVRRTALLRGALAVALAAALAAEVALARGREVRESGFVARGTTPVVVLDVSKSVDDAVYRRISRVLHRIVELDEPLGLVFFSDVAYELMPPGSPAGALEPFLPYFSPRRQSEAGASEGVFGANPWSDTLSGGTKISFGLETARAAIRRDGVERPSVLLVSDLDTAHADEPRLVETLARFAAEGIELRIVPLFPVADDRELFERVVGAEAFLDPGELTSTGERRIARRLDGASPEPLLLAGGLLLLLLAGNERLLARLPVPQERRSP